MAGSRDPTATSALQEHRVTLYPHRGGASEPQLPALGTCWKHRISASPPPTPPPLIRTCILARLPEGITLMSKFGKP